MDHHPDRAADREPEHGVGARANVLASGGRGTIPAAAGIAIDGEWDEPAWNAVAITGDFVATGGDEAGGGDDAGGPAIPVSQIRLLAEPDQLAIGLYAADEDLRASDHFELQLAALPAFAIDVNGELSPALAGVRAAADHDGTIDQPADDDEEWVIELTVPRARLPADALAVTAARCDVTKSGLRRCGRWTATLAWPPSSR